ncbi:hypothetical protein MBLNU230_g7637t1 [Neophaeotheca triangularis]
MSALRSKLLAATKRAKITQPTSYICPQCRFLSSTIPLLSGHNRWSKIKHDKGKADAAKNRQRSIFASEIATASRLFGPEPTSNPRLTDLITKAKREGFAKQSIEAAIARGQGKSSSGESLESVSVEAVMPGNVGVIVEAETTSRLRSLSAIKLAIKEAGGVATPTQYLFQKVGRVIFEAKEGVGMEHVLEAAIEAGAEDLEEDEDGAVIITTQPEYTKALGDAVSKAHGLQIATSEIAWMPNEGTMVGIAKSETARTLVEFMDDLEEKETSLQGVAMNVFQDEGLSDEDWASLAERIAA